MWAQTTYKLTQVTSVEADSRYVLVQDGHALTTVSSKAIQSTDTYSTTGLTGSESYIWTLSGGTNGFYMEMSDGNYLGNSSKKTDMTSQTSKSTVWEFAVQTNGTFKISNPNNSDRFIGNNGSNAYKAYATGGEDAYPWEFNVYKLEEEGDVSPLASIAISGTYPTTFRVGDAFSHEGMIVTATYEDATTNDVTASATFSGYDMSTTGSQTVTVSYTEGEVTKTATYAITVEAIPTHTATFSVDGQTTTEDFEEGADIEFPDVNNPEGYTFMGWTTNEIATPQENAPTIVTGATMGEANVTFYAVFAKETESIADITKTYGFETESDTDWTIDGPVRTEGEGNTGSYAGKISTNNTYVTFNNKVKVKEFSFAFKRTSNNTNYNVIIETSTDNSEWTAAETYAMSDFSNGSYTTKTKSFDGNTELFVRFHCNNTTAIRYVDDVTITYSAATTTYSGYCTTIPTPTITVENATVSVDAAEHEGTMAISIENMTITSTEDLGIQFYDAEGAELSSNNEPDWIEVLVAAQDPNVGEGYVVSYYMVENDGAERTAYCKVFAMGGDDFVYSNLITITQEAAPTATITISSNCTDGTLCYGTYSNDMAFIVPADLDVYEVNAEGGELLKEKYSTGDIVPAHTGVLVAALEGGNYPITLSYAAGTSKLVNDNMLRAAGNSGITASAMAENDPDCLYYRLTMHNGTTIGFWWGAEDGAAFASGANKAYLAVPETQAKNMGFEFGQDGDATEIILNALSEKNDAPAYNMQGQRVADGYKGIVIKNGKKFMVK